MGHAGCQEAPEQSLGEDQAEMTSGVGMANGERPADLVAERFAQGVSRVNGLDGLPADGYLVAKGGKAIAKLVVVSELIGEIFETANFTQAALGGGHGGAQREIDHAQLPSGDDAGVEVG